MRLKGEVNNMKRPTQMSEILAYMQAGNRITSMQAIEMFGATRLSAIIFDLRNKYGYNIITHDRVGKNRYGGTVTYAEYELIKED